ncbi:MAG: hypothetical protein EOP21_03305 [Hyphomicrobiales bacterium]|nr:MAG: hypothetical protein EOP21_03305 [Hyphomicrobiales bacterium]
MSEPGIIRTELNFCEPGASRGRYDIYELWRTNLKFSAKPVVIRDARLREEPLRFHNEGVELLNAPMKSAFSKDKDELLRHYVPEVAEIAKSLTGAHTALPLLNGLTVRTAGHNKQIARAQAAHFTHLDYTVKSARGYVGTAMEWAGLTSVPEYSRLAVVQCWRPTTAPPHDEPLAFADGRTVMPDDLVPFDTIHGPEGDPANFESCGARYSPAYDWNYFSNFNTDEILFFKSIDTVENAPQRVIHSAFFDRSVEGAIPRENVEVRLLMLIA